MGQRGLHFGCKVQAPCCAPGKSQKLRCQPWSCSSLLAPCALQRPSTLARVSPRTRPTVLLVKSQVSLSRFCKKMVSGLLLAPSCGLRAAQGPCRLPRERGKAVPTRWASLERVCLHSGYWPIWKGRAAGWLRNVHFLPWGPGEPLLGRPLHPWAFVQLAVVQQGSSWALLFQVHLLGNISF